MGRSCVTIVGDDSLIRIRERSLASTLGLTLLVTVAARTSHLLTISSSPYHQLHTTVHTLARPKFQKILVDDDGHGNAPTPSHFPLVLEAARISIPSLLGYFGRSRDAVLGCAAHEDVALPFAVSSELGNGGVGSGDDLGMSLSFVGAADCFIRLLSSMAHVP